MNYKYLVYTVKPHLLQDELTKRGLDQWELISIVLLQTIAPGIMVNGVPKIELQYQLFFKKPDHDDKN